MKSKSIQIAIWFCVACLGAFAFATIALRRGEPINAMWLVLAALCTYALGYRFYSRFLAAKVLMLDSMRATPAERMENGRDFMPTNKWVVFGHHFAAIAGPGAAGGSCAGCAVWLSSGDACGFWQAQFLPDACRTLSSWCFQSVATASRWGRWRARKSARPPEQWRFIAVLSILVILLAVVALIIVNALKDSPWGTFTIGMTIPIAVLMGIYLRNLRPGRVLEASAIGFALVLLAILGGQWVSHSPSWAGVFTLSATTLAILIIVYGFAASALPVWMLLAPRDYLSTFVKLGTVAILALGIVLVRPTLQMPALTRFIDGSGPVFAGNLFPFAFITIACGAISGFHSLISSGTTPKLIARETQTRMVGYGAMMAESFVGIMAMVAACTLQPGAYFAVNSGAGMVGGNPTAAVATITPVGLSRIHCADGGAGIRCR